MNPNEIRQKLIEKDFCSMNDRQFEAVTTVNGPLLVLAGAGSGKTTVLVNRIAYLCKYGNAYKSEKPVVCSSDDIKAAEDYLSGKSAVLQTDAFADDPPRPYRILAITFTNKAADELKNRISAKLGGNTDVWAGTFHSICGRILRRYADRIGYSSHFTVYDADDQKRLMRDIIKSAENIDEKIFTPKGVLSYISAAKDALIDEEEFAAGAAGDLRRKTVAVLYKEYQKRLRAADAMDFDDMIFYTVKLISENRDVLEEYSDKFLYIMVDEYQDTNYAQFCLVRLLATVHKNICVVGDDDQSIYRFRGATIENILNFEKHFENAKVIRLEQNYRSTSNILDAANSVISNNRSRKGKVLWTDSGSGEKIKVFVAENGPAEARQVANSITDYVSGGGKFSDCAVLYRMNSQSAPFENAFTRSGISYRVIGGFRFYERKEIKDVLAYLCLINNKNDTVRLKRIINEPARGIGETTVKKIETIANANNISLFEVISNANEYPPLSSAAAKLSYFCGLINGLSANLETMPLPALFDKVLADVGYKEAILAADEPDAQDRIYNIEELKNNIVLFCEENENATLSSFLEEVALVNDIDSLNQDDDKVTLMTIHSAKGLEFPCVYLVGMEEGIFPGNQSVYGLPEDIEEERRLAYVAITRAKKQLNISRAAMRMLYGKTNRNIPSRFLNEIPPDLCSTVSAGGYYGAQNDYQTGGGYRPSGDGYGMSGGYGSFDVNAVTIRNTNPPKADSSKYRVGQNVEHSVFGTGTIKSVSPMGNDTLLEIAFESGIKKIMANYAKLNII